MTDPREAFRAVVLSALGRAPDAIEPGRLHRFATSDKRGDDAGWCKLFIDLRGGVYGCYRAGISDIWQADRGRPMTRLQRLTLARQVVESTIERDRQQRQQWAANGQRNSRLWSQCVPLVPGDPVTLYLKRRGFGAVWPLPGCLRFHRALPYWNGDQNVGTFPAMVAPLMTPEGRLVALHRTYLTLDGRKAAVATVKKLTGTTGPLAGAFVPLHEPVRAVLGVAEGIESALAAWCATGVPTVAAYSATNLAAWRWPGAVREVLVYADNDRAGRDAAETLRARAAAAGVRCKVVEPSDNGADWCDQWSLIQAGPTGEALP